MNNDTVCAVIPTKDRYFTTLPLALLSVINQTYKVEEILIMDDSENRLDGDTIGQKHPLLLAILKTAESKGIKWRVIFGERRGQATLHNMSIKLATTKWIWRLDDDNYAESDVLEKLIGTARMRKKKGKGVGGVAGCVYNPGMIFPPSTFASSKITDWYLSLNVQWFEHKPPKILEVDQFYSTFIYLREASEHGYNLSLSPVSHTEESQFSYEIKRKGYELLVNTSAITWHYRCSEGGIRSYRDHFLWAHDSKIMDEKMREWGVKQNKKKLIVLDNGIGDHLAFLDIYGIIKEKYPDYEFIIACCYPEVFEGLGDAVKLTSIHEARVVKEGNIDAYSVYKWMWDHNWKEHIQKAYLKMYVDEGVGTHG